MAEVKEGVAVEFGAKTAPFLAGINMAQASVGAFVGFAGMQLARLVRDSERVSTSWEKSMGSIATIADATKGQLASMRSDMAAFSVKFGQDFETVAKARYNIISSGFAGIADSMMIMTEAGKGAVGGLTTMDSAARALTAVLNAYELQAKDATRINDILFTTAKLGVPSYEELASVIGDVASTAKAARVPVEDLFAAMATVSLAGISAPETATAVNRLLLSLINPGKETTRVLKELGITLNGPEGLGGALKAIGRASDESFEKLASAIPEMRALKGALAGAAEDGERYRKVLDGIKSSTGAADQATATMLGTMDSQRARLKAATEEYKSEVGRLTAPEVSSWVLWRTTIVQAMTDVTKAMQRAREAQASNGGSMFSGEGGPVWAPTGKPSSLPMFGPGGIGGTSGLSTAYPIGMKGTPFPQNSVSTVASWVTEMNAAMATLQASRQWNGLSNAGPGEFARKTLSDVKDAGLVGATERSFGTLNLTRGEEMAGAGYAARKQNEQAATYEKAAQKMQMLGQIGQTVMTNMSSMIQNGIYGGLVRAFGGGQSAMAQFAAQTISQIATIIVQATILKGILSALGLGGLPFESGGYTGMKEFAWGGYTGGGGAGGVAGVVHRGEYVLNSQATQAIGIQNLDRMNRSGGDTFRVGDIHIHGTSGEMSRTIAEEIRDALPRAIRDATRTGYMREALAIGRA